MSKSDVAVGLFLCAAVCLLVWSVYTGHILKTPVPEPTAPDRIATCYSGGAVIHQSRASAPDWLVWHDVATGAKVVDVSRGVNCITHELESGMVLSAYLVAPQQPIVGAIHVWMSTVDREWHWSVWTGEEWEEFYSLGENR